MSDPSGGKSEHPLFDGILVINARSFVDRRRNIERQLGAIGWEYEFIHTHDAGDLDAATIQRYFNTLSLTAGQQSCAMKHLDALRRVVERHWRRALILEDDVLLAPDFLEGVRAAVKESSDVVRPHIVFIGNGGNFYTPRSLRVSGQRLYKAPKGRFADSYILGSEAARLRVEWIERHGIRGSIDCHFDATDPELGIEWYWLEEPVVEQGSKNGTFSSMLEPAPRRFIQGIRFGLEKLRRKYLYQLWR
jgi:glycosyl transferase family 25